MSRVPGRPVAARIAWRQARRAKWRTALVVATVALPVAALSLGLVLIRTVMPSEEQRATETMGSADLFVDWYGEPKGFQALAESFPPGSRITTGRNEGVEEIVGGARVLFDFTEWSTPMDRPPVAGRYRLVAGRPPSAPDEVALHPYFLKVFGAKVGDRVDLPVRKLHLTVTGIVADPANLDQPLAVLGPGTLDNGNDAASGKGPASRRMLIRLPAGLDPAMVRDGLLPQLNGSYGLTREEAGLGDKQARRVAAAAAFGGTTLALFGTGLVAAAAFVVGARRQLRALGLVAAAGGEPKQVRRMVLMGGVVLGLAGSAVGLAVGLAVAGVLYPHLEGFLHRAMGPLQIPWMWLIGAFALGTVAATLAAYGPARSAGKLPPVEALAGRAAPPRPPGRLARRGLVLLALATAALVATTIARSIPGLIASLVGMVCGFLFAIPLVTTWAGRLAKRLPTSGRIAAREVSRYGRRTGAALAAATMVLALPVSVSALTLSEEVYARPDDPPMAADHLVLTLSPVTPTPGVERREFLADVRAAVPGAQVVEMRQAGVPVPANEAAGIPENYFATVYVIGPTRQDSQGVTEILSGPLIIGGPDLLEALHAGDGIDALKAGKIVGIGPGTVGPEGTVGVPDPLDENFNLAAGDSGPTHPAVEAGESRYAQLGLGGSENYVVSPKEARRMGLHAQSDPAMGYWWILRAPRAIDAGTLSAAQSAAAKHQGAFISDGRYQGRSDAFIRMVLTAVAAAVALIIVGVVVALVTSESRRDHAILVAVGAGPGMRRKVVGANAWLLGTLGGLLAVPAGFLPVIVIQLARQAGRTVVVPWTAIGVAVVAVPAVAGLIAAATSRQPKAVQLLRPIA